MVLNEVLYETADLLVEGLEFGRVGLLSLEYLGAVDELERVLDHIQLVFLVMGFDE